MNARMRSPAKFMFDNDFAALAPDTPPGETDRKGLLVAQSERGICRVVCFSPRHDLTLARMDRRALRGVVDVWVEETRMLGAEEAINYVQQILLHGTGADRQLEVWNQSNDMKAVVDYIVDETHYGLDLG